MDDVQKSRLLHFILVIYMLLALPFARAEVVNITPEMQEAASQSANVIIPKHIKAKIDKMQATVNSAEWKQQQEIMKQRIAASLGFENKGEDNKTETQNTEDRPVLFVSSSMPLSTLRAYAISLAKTNGVMVLRGGVQGLKKIGPTLKFTAEILKKDSLCEGPRCPMLPTPVLIDPVLFQRYEIKMVPALVFQEQMNLASYCERPEELSTNSKVIIYGDASLGGMLQELHRMTKSPKLKPHIKRLETI